MTSRPPGKLYYSIGEVAEMTDLEPSVLRFWESEFSQLRPKKNRAGNRMYREKDIKFILEIKRLTREEGYTIAGAKKKIQESYKATDEASDAADREAALDLLASIRAELVELREMLE
ncbi:MAG: MerR family transcriptional regulator [Candidatus Latescibacteria bacterium]|nr:MerR family transcriptional regulator [Candidatus Latescibacterota bacterium]